MLLVIDNYDSFTYNLVHLIGTVGRGRRIEVVRNDAASTRELLALEPDAIILSPGPCTPTEAGVCLDLVRSARDIPVFGVCLGHQSIAQAFGGSVPRAPTLMHGKVDDVFHDGTGVFEGLPSPFRATRYHSLTVEEATLPDGFVVNARAGDVVMGLRHETRPHHGVQFHPESIASEHGEGLVANFLAIADAVNAKRPARPDAA